EWMIKAPYSKQDLEYFETSTHLRDLRTDGITQEEYDRRHCQQRYEYSGRLTINKIKNLERNDLIIYLEQVLEKGLLQPEEFNRRESNWHLLEEYLFKHVTKTQLEELPEKYQLLLGYQDGEKIFQIESIMRAKATKAKAIKAKAAKAVKAKQIKELKPSDSQGKNGKFRVSVLEKVVDGKEKYLTVTVETIGEAKYWRRIFTEEVDKANQTAWDRFKAWWEDVEILGWLLLSIYLVIPLFLLGLCTGLIEPNEGWKCSDSSLTDSQERACDRAFEDAYEKKWGKSPYGN
ncbi:hypothetical protein OAQ74_03310, partial [Gammaproteobacteria bacterium]|nr:hypothetical protein [Gammaproteobacteria bacterium]